MVITGRGNQSQDRIAVVRPAVAKQLEVLRRQGVVAAVREHTAGSFVVTLAPLSALLAAPPRRRDAPPPPPADPREVQALAEDLRRDLRVLALRALEELGVPPRDEFVASEMRAIVARLTAGRAHVVDLEAYLRTAVRAALDEG